MFKKIVKKISQLLGFGIFLSLKLAIKQQRLDKMIPRLRTIVPDLSHQESRKEKNFSEFVELKRRALQSFQCNLMLKALESFRHKKALTVVDIGDSAGTHMLYLKDLTNGQYDIDTISVNLDPRVIGKIKAHGLKAVLCRAEDLDLNGKEVDLFTSFETVEHLHDPANFFYHLSKNFSCNRIAITVPYLRSSRVGLYYTRNHANKQIYAEDEHIFELSPYDWSLLIRHSGWKVIYSKIYYQYPKILPIVSSFMGLFWRKMEFEGFWGAILEKDTTISDCYQDWEK